MAGGTISPTMKENPLIRAWLESLTVGCIECTRDWRDSEVPAVRLVGHGTKRVFSTFDRAPRHAAARRYGYFVQEDGQLIFALPDEATAEKQVYVAGDFNGWEKAVGDPAWLLQPGKLNGEAMLLWSGPAEQFWVKPHQQFKFVTAEHQWLNVPENAPNAVPGPGGNVNHELDRERTGRQFFRFKLKKPLDLSMAWRIAPAVAGVEGVPLQPGDFFFSLGTDLPLGATVRRGQTVFRLFAPRVSEVKLFLTEKPGESADVQITTLERNAEEPYIWETTQKNNLHGWFYWYQLDGVRDTTGRFDPDVKVLDPYALATVSYAGPGIVIDRARIGPADRGFVTPQWQDLIIAEAHVRDLAAHAPVALSPEERLGFTGLRKWVESPDFYLQQLGVNCVELQPVQEFDNRTREEYHWGYMTTNWFAPASSYALAPAEASGIAELQALVAAFHRRGMAVLLDVVFNHVGEPPHLLFIDKLYYFEQDARGELSNWSGCGNDVRAHAAMAKRLIIDSCKHLIETYGVDGFRFDLAELLGSDVLRDIEQALKKVKRNVILIAEPWSYRGHIAGSLRDTGWSSWNDGYRDFMRSYVRGGGTAETFEYYIKGSPWYWAKWPAQTVNYSESHDDRTWIDEITENSHHNGQSPTANDRRRTQLMAAVLFASIGIPMIAAGQDFLRSKGGVNNTYLRGDLNALDYRRLFRFPGTHAYFADWIAFRRSSAGRLLRQWERPSEGFFKVIAAPDSIACAVIYNLDGSQGRDRLLFAVNPTTVDITIPLGETLPAAVNWRQIADHERFFSGHGVQQPVESELFLPALGCGLWRGET
ncbi:MAG: glycoside hydrolase family 1 [Cephaloticoccus sp.]|nr:glycoside hydrolase family 1 [Cephaloticoccus sp.]MCF7761854.1 glycoside hydrolase family 1 [Cephaloticoccus sp.]